MFIFNWIKRNLVSSVLIVIILFLLVNQFGVQPLRFDSSESMLQTASVGEAKMGAPAALSRDMMYPIEPDFAPQPDVANRLVIENSYLSLLVQDVVAVRKQIVEFAQNSGGYMVNSSVENPQDAPTASVTVRIPSVKLEETLEKLRALSIKVVSENLDGTDVTDQFVDIEKHIAILEQTKAKFEQILTSAQEISDIVNLNQQIISIQNQIDSYKGQQAALEKNAQLAKVTIYLSTDEIALPYAPSDTFRPAVIFKLAVRSLITHLRQIGTVLIWIAVYAVVWVPIVIAGWFFYRRMSKKG